MKLARSKIYGEKVAYRSAQECQEDGKNSFENDECCMFGTRIATCSEKSRRAVVMIRRT